MYENNGLLNRFYFNLKLNNQRTNSNSWSLNHVCIGNDITQLRWIRKQGVVTSSRQL